MRDTRELKILDHVRAQRTASVIELAAATDSSVATIRRDLQRLDEAGLLRRTHGGAVVAEQDSPFAEVETVNAEAKARIAARAAESVHDGESVLVDIGTTTVQLARRLRGRRITVVTPSLMVYEALRDEHTTHLILLPGDVDPVYRAVSGPLTTECLRSIRVDRAFLGVSGVAENGDLRDTTLGQLPIKRAMAQISARRTVLADAGKFPGTGAGVLPIAGWLDEIITDATPPAVTAAALAARSVQVVLA